MNDCTHPLRWNGTRFGHTCTCIAVSTRTDEVKTDPVSKPNHYNTGKIEVIEFIEDQGLGFCLGNLVKYVCRAGKKDPSKHLEDLKKAQWYLEREIKRLGGK